MGKANKTAITPTREANYPEWYQQVIQAADLAESSPVRGCMIIKPHGYAIWENIQRALDDMFKETGHENAYFPLLIPLSFLEKEAEHVEGFAKECAVVTHHRLTEQEGKLIPDGALEEPYVIRPTSETIIGTQFAKWIQSYRDLPLLINQWANVMRWEMRTRLFLRTSEFLWQEGHTAHSSQEEAIVETKQMLEVYRTFSEDYLAMPVICGEKTPEERFPGALNTYCIEAMMQDKKALQAGTSHFLGQNFSKSFNITYAAESGQVEHVWTTSWGVSTRLIGGLIMTHSDDNGLVLPPRIAPTHVVIIPIYRNETDKEQVLSYCESLHQELKGLYFHERKLSVKIDNRDINGGEKQWQHIKKGTPIRIEVGPRDIEKNAVVMKRRDLPHTEKAFLGKDDFISQVVDTLNEIQNNLFNKALSFREENTTSISSLDEFKASFSDKGPGGFVRCYSSLDPSILEILKPLKVTARCIPLEQPALPGKCIFTGEQTNTEVIYAKAY